LTLLDEDGVGQTKLGASGQFVRGSGCAHRGRAKSGRNLNGSGADTAGDSVKKNHLARPQPTLQHDRVVRCQEHFGNGRRLFQRQLLRNRHELGGFSHHAGCHRAAAHDSHHAVAGLPCADRIADRLDDARELEARHVRRNAGGRRIETTALQAIGAVESGGGHLDHDLRRFGVWQLDLAELEHLGSAGLTNANRFCFGHTTKRNAPPVYVQRCLSC
jgi:hypothetical protein